MQGQSKPLIGLRESKTCAGFNFSFAIWQWWMRKEGKEKKKVSPFRSKREFVLGFLESIGQVPQIWTAIKPRHTNSKDCASTGGCSPGSKRIKQEICTPQKKNPFFPIALLSFALSQ
jgi:hypothetical protein